MGKIINNIEIGDKLYGISDEFELRYFLSNRDEDGWRLPTTAEFKLFKWMYDNKIGNFGQWDYWVVYKVSRVFVLLGFGGYPYDNIYDRNYPRRLLMVRDVKKEG